MTFDLLRRRPIGPPFCFNGPMSTTRNIHLLVTGNEQLSGKRQDKHFAKVITLLAARGMSLSQVTFLGDDEARIAAVIRMAHSHGDILLCSGGIGATPDDRTRQACAAAFGVPVVRHVEGEALIAAQYGERAYPNRVLMADFPQGATLIPNPVNRVSGFSMNDCHFVPGFPEMAWPMLEWVLDHHYPQLHQASPALEYRLRAMGSAAEGDLLDLMEEVIAAHPGLEFSSLPFRGRDDQPPHIEFGFKGERAVAASAYRQFEAGLQARNLPLQPQVPPE
jgi:molybdopterin-biosynthesis enzyme MoeA-like protein